MVAKLLVTSNGLLRWEHRCVPCTLGRSGITHTKTEGDGATCAGEYFFRRIFFRHDRVEIPYVHLPVQALSFRDGWCDDTYDPQYNRYVRLPYSGRHEGLWRKDSLYDIIVVIGYNDDPVMKGKGSAIFLHIADPDFRPTQGCVAVCQEHMLELITHIHPHTVLCIVQEESFCDVSL